MRVSEALDERRAESHEALFETMKTVGHSVFTIWEHETKRGGEPWTVTLYLCEKFRGQIRTTEDREEPIWLSIVDVLAGKYKMPQMSSTYFSLILKTLRNHSETLP